MKTLARLGSPALAACAVVALVAGTASAATTTIRAGSATAPAYSGAWQISNLGNLSFKATVLGISATASCTTATFTGSVTSTGTGSLNTAAVSGCTSSLGGSASITFQNLPYTHGTVSYGPVSGGRDGTLTFTDTNLKIKVVINLLGTHTCYYGFGSTVSSLTFNFFNPTNPNRPNTSVAQAEGQMSNATLDVLSGSDSICPSNGSANGVAQALGETVAGSGVYNQTLFVTS